MSKEYDNYDDDDDQSCDYFCEFQQNWLDFILCKIDGYIRSLF